MNSRNNVIMGLSICCAVLVGTLVGGASTPALGRAQQQAKHPFAVCDVWTISYELAMSDRYKDDEARLDAAYESDVLPKYKELMELREKIIAIPAEDKAGEENPERERLIEEYHELDEKYEAASDALNERRESEFALRLRACVRSVCEAAEEVAADEGYSYVLASCDIEANDRMSKAVRARNRERDKQFDRSAGDEDESDQESETLDYRQVFYVETFRSVAHAPAETRIDDLIRDRLSISQSKGR